MGCGIGHIVEAQAEGIYGRIVNPVGRDDVLRQLRLKRFGLSAIHLLYRDAVLLAMVRKVCNISFAVTCNGNKHTTSVFAAFRSKLS